MNATPCLLSAIVTICAVVLYFFTSVNVGRMRVKHKIKAPATAGHSEFERAYRVQMNTLEQLPVFLTMLWLATIYFTPLPVLPAAIGVVWLAGRALYSKAYMADPAKRGPGFGISALAQLTLLLLSVVGVGLGFFS
jgi:glutathione S-transferase